THLHNINTEGLDKPYSLYGLSAVFGFGIKYSLGSRVGIGLEWGMRKTFTDYLDDISGEYKLDFNNLDIVIDNETDWEDVLPIVLSDPSPVKHQPGMQRGNPQNNDWYSFAGLTLIYRFSIGEKSTCPDFENVKNK
ncbi:MAG: hypothetical protein ACOCX8_02215, partial [Bacteroidota bacterium]